MDRVEHDLTAEQWTALKGEWGGCAYCGATDQPLQKDCVQALSRGGRYTLPNIAPACRSCNASKSNDEVTGWMRRKKLDERTFLVRHYEIGKLLIERFPEEPAVDRQRHPTTNTPAPHQHPATTSTSMTPALRSAAHGTRGQQHGTRTGAGQKR
jgi:hypothetical protein